MFYLEHSKCEKVHSYLLATLSHIHFLFSIFEPIQICFILIVEDLKKLDREQFFSFPAYKWELRVYDSCDRYLMTETRAE